MASPENNVILKMSREHSLILQELKRIEDCLKKIGPDETIRTLKANIETFEHEFIKHMRLEEMIIFKAGLEGLPTHKNITDILELQKEHGVMEIQLQVLAQKIWKFSGSHPEFLEIGQQTKDLIRDIKQHSAKEVKTVFPLLSNNPKCLKLIALYSQAPKK